MHDDEDESDLEYLDEQPKIVYADEPRNKINRGGEINLTQKDPTMKKILVGVGWDLKAFDMNPLDLDASLLLLDKNGQTRVDEDFVFYNNLSGADGAVSHLGDSRTGAGDGDDEVIKIDLMGLSFDVVKILFVLSIYDMDLNGHDFSMVKNVYFRIVNENTEHEIFRYELDEELTGGEGLVIGEMERVGSDWTFRAIGQTVENGLGQIAGDCGMIIKENMQ